MRKKKLKEKYILEFVQKAKSKNVRQRQCSKSSVSNLKHFQTSFAVNSEYILKYFLVLKSFVIIKVKY